jgi:hypothetical protein
MGIALKDLSLRMIRPNDHTPVSLWKGLLGVGVITLSRLSHSDRLSGLSWAQKQQFPDNLKMPSQKSFSICPFVNMAV